MAPKRSAKKAAPLPPAASSEETDSRSRSEESEDEDAIAESPPPAPNNTPAPPHKGDEEEEDESDDDEEPAHAAPAAAPTPKNQPPPPQQREDPETSEEEEEEEEEEEPTQAGPPSAPKKQPLPQQTDEEEEEGESEEEEEEELAPKQVPEGVKPQAADETKKPATFSRIWSTDDDVRILEALAAHQKQHGTLPQPDALADALAGKLDNRAYGSKELQAKVGTLKRRYLALSKKGELPSKEHDRRVLDLSRTVWGGDKSTAAAASVKTASNDHKRKRFEEMCELFPYLAEEVKELMVENPGMFKREFGKMDDEKARVMDEKIKKQRVAQMKVGLRRQDLTREVTKAIIDLVD